MEHMGIFTSCARARFWPSGRLGADVWDGHVVAGHDHVTPRYGVCRTVVHVSHVAALCALRRTVVVDVDDGAVQSQPHRAFWLVEAGVIERCGHHVGHCVTCRNFWDEAPHQHAGHRRVAVREVVDVRLGDEVHRATDQSLEGAEARAAEARQAECKCLERRLPYPCRHRSRNYPCAAPPAMRLAL